MARHGVKSERAASRARASLRFGRLSSGKEVRVATSKLVSLNLHLALPNARFRIGPTSLSPIRNK
eukprot:14975717-Alexandrium_andersonii.AAC.1